MNQTKNIIASLALFAVLVPTSVALAHDDERERSQRPTDAGVQIFATHDGNVLVRGAKVTGVASSTITATTAWGGTTLTWSVLTDGTTEFVSRSNGAIQLGNIAVGDTINFAGAWVPGTALSVTAKVVKNVNSITEPVTLKGTVQSVATSTQSFVLSYNSTTTVHASSSSITLNGSNATFADLQVGDSVKVKGVWNTEHTILSASSVKITRNASSTSSSDDRQFSKLLRQWLKDKGIFKVKFDD